MVISKRKLAGLKGVRTKHQDFIDRRKKEKEALEKYLVVVKEMIDSGVLRSGGGNHHHVFCVPIWTGGSKVGLVETIEKHITYAQLDINEYQAKLDVLNDKIQNAERENIDEIHS